LNIASENEGINDRLAKLTDKQREVLALVVERKTSKQIARILNISKPAVDQRIANARDALGVSNRDEAALIFMQEGATYDRITYDPACVPISTRDSSSSDWEERSQIPSVPDGNEVNIDQPALRVRLDQPGHLRSLILERLSGENRVFSRLSVILLGAVAIISLLLISLSTLEILSRLISTS
jgi:DNA-binding CsgD family transcriptional regulator